MEGISLAAVGDVMLGDHPVVYGHGVRSKIRRAETIIDPAITGLMRGADVILGNLECVLSDIGHDESKLTSSEMRGDISSVPLLLDAGFNVMTVANNHMLQHGVAAFEDTVSRLNAAGIRTVGEFVEGKSNIAEFQCGTESLIVVGYSFRPEHFCKNNVHYASPSPEIVLEQVREIVSSRPGSALVVTLHWGEEYLHVPSAWQVEFAHRLIDAGVAAVVGHHPHVLQGIEEYNGGLIAYSLGNFVFDSWQSSTRESIVLCCTFKSGRLLSYTSHPVQINRQLFVHIPAEAGALGIRQKLLAYTSAIKNREFPMGLDEGGYAEVAAKAYLRYRLECYLYFVLHIWKYDPKTVGYSFLRSFMRRLGLA